jgi:hypothetical protein
VCFLSRKEHKQVGQNVSDFIFHINQVHSRFRVYRSYLIFRKYVKVITLKKWNTLNSSFYTLASMNPCLALMYTMLWKRIRNLWSSQCVIREAGLFDRNATAWFERHRPASLPVSLDYRVTNESTKKTLYKYYTPKKTSWSHHNSEQKKKYSYSY